ncbi:MATE family efflux transporter [Subdoligranulum variabile]|uniref:MATE family efflux transporter n=1 Tax=Subdoligranulum variabile TaxID=214851 RepID=UPI002942FBD8|nr:MATE family efflux transporter [Subdoligranulum variabile]
MERNLTTGSVLRNILYFSLPYLLSYFLQTLYGMADLFIIGQFEGSASTTAVSVGSQVMHMITVMIVGLAMGSTVSIGRSIGAGEHKRVSAIIGNTVSLFMVVSVGLMAVLLLLVQPIVTVMSTPAEAVAGTRAYLTICFIGIPCITAYNIISSIFRGLGDSKSPMYFIAVACVANIALDYLFIGAMGLGPAGAALGTTLSQAISVVVSLVVILKRKTGISLHRADLKLRRPVLRQVLKIGLPVAFQDGFIQIAFIVITIIANRRGLNDAAAVGIVEKVISFLFLVPSSMLSTVSALGAQNIGAGKHDRTALTLRYAILISAGFGLCISIVMQWIAEPVVSLFTTDPLVITAGGQYIRGYIWDCLFAGIHFSFSGYFCAYGRSEISFLHNICAILIMRIPGVYLMSTLFPNTLFPMGLATVGGSILSIIICVVAFVYLKRRGAFSSLSANV